MQKPTVGRIVHYHPYPTQQDPTPDARAAIVTQVPKNLKAAAGEPWVGLCILNPGGMSWGLFPHSEALKAGSWSWPPRDVPSVSI